MSKYSICITCLALLISLILSSTSLIAQEVYSNNLGTQLWFAGHETGNQSEWTADGGGGEYNSGTGNSAVSSEQAKSGNRSLKLSINTTSGDSHGTRNYRWNEITKHEDLIYTIYMYFPHRIDFDPNNAWFNLIQTKGVKYASGGPGTGPDQINNPHYVVGLGVRGGAGSGGANYLTLADLQRFWGGSTNIVWQAPNGVNLPTQKWVKIQMRIIQKRDDTGRILIWQDDQLIIDSGNRNTLRPEVDDNHFSINAYADKTFPNRTSFYIDDVSINLPSNNNQEEQPNQINLSASPDSHGSVRAAVKKENASVIIKSPSDNFEIDLNSQVKIEGEYSHPSSNISKIEFYEGKNLIGNKSQAPFEYNWSPQSKGVYSLRIKAFFENGDQTFSNPVTVVVK
ncbi:Ig-like domain-containing protein [Indibacter alkaliphilus]|nr:Ig-like domain-containing protein [Indibacter alkaliphilus]